MIMLNNDAYKYGRYFVQNQETRWATIDEIKNSSTYINLSDEHYPVGGLPLLSNAKEAYVDGNDTHSLIFGATGSKKTRLFCMPLINILLKSGESFIATDPKGELYDKTAGLAKAMGYKTVVLNFRDIGKGDMWNPLSLPYELYHDGKKDEAVSLLNDFIATLSDPGTLRTIDAFWTNTSKSLALAHMLTLMEYALPEEVNMSSFVGMCSSSIIEELQEDLEFFDENSIGSVNYRSCLSGSEKTSQNIVVSLYSCVSIFMTQKNLSSMLSKNTFDIRNFGREKTAVYIIVPDEKTTLHFLVTTFIKQAYEILIREAQKEKALKLPVRVNFVLDEFCNIPKIPDMPSMISAARSRNMRYFLVAQSKHQLVGKYGEDADTIKGNCDNWVFLTSKELDLLNEISELCGSVRDHNGLERRLISVSELQRLDKEKGEALIMHARQYPIITEMADISDYKMFEGYTAPQLSYTQLDDAPVFSMPNFLAAVYEIRRRDDFYIFANTLDELLSFIEKRYEDNPRRVNSYLRTFYDHCIAPQAEDTQADETNDEASSEGDNGENDEIFSPDLDEPDDFDLDDDDIENFDLQTDFEEKSDELFGNKSSADSDEEGDC